jgi:hypothetical protein
MNKYHVQKYHDPTETVEADGFKVCSIGCLVFYLVCDAQHPEFKAQFTVEVEVFASGEWKHVTKV